MDNYEFLIISVGLLILLVLVWLGIRLFPRVKAWAETFISKTITDIVNNFWEQQSKKLADSREQKAKRKTEEKEKKIKEELSHGVLLDTSVLIDGRILDIVKTGFMTGPFIVPKIVINELHLVSDSEDKLKREKGRRGLDMLKELKSLSKVIVLNQQSSENQADKELIDVAKNYKVRLMTLDFNLNKVAGVSGIKVLNINELVNAVKTSVLPGEELSVKIVQEGKEKEQGVGYMPDGTMIVVEGARALVGSDVMAKVSRVIQTNAGKMIFCNVLA
jgi:uncharacterized protein YacL